MAELDPSDMDDLRAFLAASVSRTPSDKLAERVISQVNRRQPRWRLITRLIVPPVIGRAVILAGFLRVLGRRRQ